MKSFQALGKFFTQLGKGGKKMPKLMDAERAARGKLGMLDDAAGAFGKGVGYTAGMAKEVGKRYPKSVALAGGLAGGAAANEALDDDEDDKKKKKRPYMD